MKSPAERKEVSLTPAQRACLAPARNVMVSAGAGSGKTFLLVKKIGDLFSGGNTGHKAAGVENVLALTFTRKAAGEMRGRIYKELLDRIDVMPDGPLKEHLVDVKDQFHASKISTIHGFSAAAIRSHPVEAGMDPDFVVLDDASEDALIGSAVRFVLRELWRKGDEDLLRILEIWEPYQIRMLMQSLLARPIELNELIRTLREEDLPVFLSHVQRDKWNAFREAVCEPGGWSETIGTVADHCLNQLTQDGKGKAVLAKKEKAQRLLTHFVEPIQGMLKADSMPSVSASLFDELRKNLKEIGTFRWDALPGSQIVGGLEDAMLPWFQPLDLDKQALESIAAFLRIAARVRAVCEEEKRRQAAVVQDDLVVAAHDLAQSHSRLVRGAIDYFLVDEFQDTDPYQWETILSLALAPDGLPRNLFLVGDTKQAIYGFRGADHTVTKTARDLLRGANAKGQVELTLSENFRSRSGPLSFTNALFERLFDAAEHPANPYSVPPQSLIPQRDEGESAENSGVVCLLLQSDEANTTAAEARAVVWLLKSISEGSLPHFRSITELMGRGEPAVGILFRKYDPMPDYIGELLRAGLPFSVYHGRTFFDTPEVQTLMDLLAWLADPGDEPAAAGVLRSPLFAWTDEDLVEVLGMPRGSMSSLEDFLHGKSEDPSLSDELRQKVGVAATTLADLKSLAAHLSLSETLRAALDRTLAPIIFGRGLRGAQTEANVEKLLAMVRDLEVSETASAQTVIKAILDIRDAGPGEAEAESPSDQRTAIQLMTVHAAKGLEFPLVIPACCGKKSGGNRRPFSKRITYEDPEEAGITRRMTLAGIDYPDPTREMQPSPTILSALVKEHDQLQSEAEEKRLLYVALTRAMDHIVIPLPLYQDKVAAAPKSHLELIVQTVPGLEEAALQEEDSLDFDGMTVGLLYDESTSAEEEAAAGIDVEVQVEIIKSRAFPPHQPIREIGEMPYPRRTRVSVTEMRMFSLCPRRFTYEKFFAQPGQITSGTVERNDDQPETSRQDRESAKSARLVGTLVHEVLEACEADVAAWKIGQPPPESVIRVIDAMEQRLRSAEPKDFRFIREEALKHVSTVARSSVLTPGEAPNSTSERPVLREAAFELERDGFIITGIIDRLEQNPDGSWRLWDYKTSRLEKRSPAEVVAESAYDVQLRIYAWAARLILNQPVSEACLVFTGAEHDPLFKVDAEPAIVERTLIDLLERMAQVLDGNLNELKTEPGSELCRHCPCRDLELC